MIRDANERRSALRICLVATGLAKGAATNRWMVRFRWRVPYLSSVLSHSRNSLELSVANCGGTKGG
jgi:hypothetical protein